MAMEDDQEFTCRAINDYYASVTDELDLKEGQTYTIMQVRCYLMNFLVPCVILFVLLLFFLSCLLDITIRMVVCSK